MIRDPNLLAVERSYSAAQARTYQDALAIFTALWREAAALRPDFPGDWREDLADDFALARALNGLALA